MNTESQNIEFKESWRDDYLKWICGFVNAQGGVLYIGIKDDGEVCGVHDAKKLMEDIPNKVRDMLGILVDVNLKEKDDKQYIEIITEAYPYPISFRGKYYQRSGATNQELKDAALDRFMLRKQGKTWDGVPVPYLKEEELDNATFDLFRKYAKRSGRMEEVDLMDDNHGLLEKLRLYEGNYLKRAAALLFHPDPERYVTGAFVKAGFFREGMDLVYQDEVHGNLFQQIAKLMDLLCTKYMKAVITYEGIQRIETLPIPREALREALLNACINKDYAEPSPIQIRVYENKMEIVNGGVLPDGWTVETLLSSHRSFPYNPDIANAFFRSGEIEAWGRGIERIITACKMMAFLLLSFVVMLRASGRYSNLSIRKEQLPKKTTQKTTQKIGLSLTEQQRAILSFLKEYPGSTRKEISENLLNITEDGVKYNLSRLQELGLLKRVGGRKQGYWQILE